MGRGYAWLDTGTHDTLIQAHQFVYTIEQRQGAKICCPEEISFKQGWIDVAALRKAGQSMKKNEYGAYLLKLVDGLIVKSQKLCFKNKVLEPEIFFDGEDIFLKFQPNNK